MKENLISLMINILVVIVKVLLFINQKMKQVYIYDKLVSLFGKIVVDKKKTLEK